MISIVTAYHNRKELFYQTLKSIEKSQFKDIELIAVDDCSSSEHRLEPYLDEFPFLKIIRLEQKDKWYINPCVPFNKGISKANGDIIVLQNPECLHVHDVLTYISENINDENYISISAYGLESRLTKLLPEHIKNGTLLDFFNTFPQRPYRGYDMSGWYNHSIYRPVHFHFCSAITRNNMKKLNGFDERFAYGIAYDDDEIVARIRILGLKLHIENSVSVIHQYHASGWNSPNAGQLCDLNRLLIDNYTRKENRYKANLNSLWTKTI